MTLSESLTAITKSILELFEDNERFKLIQFYTNNDENIFLLLMFSVAFICIFAIYILAKFYHDDKPLLKNE